MEWYAWAYIYFYIVTILTLIFDVMGRCDHEDTETIKIDGHEIEYKTGKTLYGSAEQGSTFSTDVLMLGTVFGPIIFGYFLFLYYLYESHFFDTENPLKSILFFAGIPGALIALGFYVFVLISPYCYRFFEELRWVCYSILIIDVIVGLWHMDI
ncbi:hypothetical protein DXA95_14075 [Odoribacter sp. OF09-27XD]|nr:hypothetical protein [Odoribacter sp. OF09-27XD]RHV91191.1 hypothetical protein DXA95_14075 [Odoribacter sp. OF09-27XD]